RGKTTCPDCKGSRLRKDASYVKISDKSIIDLVLISIDDLTIYFDNLKLSGESEKISSRVLKEIQTRLHYLQDVGLGYLTLNRLTSTLSGGEFQRIKLATSLGSALVGSIYVLDEPSIGLHPRDTQRLIKVLKTLKKLGNTVIVVEHEEEVMTQADQIIDIGLGAGALGGELVFQGNISEIDPKINSHTVSYLTGRDKIEIPTTRRQARSWIEIFGARENNLKGVHVKIPLKTITVVTGVSGSGKSTLIQQILYPALGRKMGIISENPGKYDRLDGDLNQIDLIEFVDQNPIGKSSRSNPVTYIKAYDPIRMLFSEQSISKQRGYKPAHFSFNVEGGRCEECLGEGHVKIEMQFMADIHLLCDSCKGARFKREVLDVEYNGLSISQVLNLTVDEAMGFFEGIDPIIHKLKPLQDVGMGYIKLGQSSNSLSGGEAQRVKLASFLSRSNSKRDEHILFIFDEPTTGLHFHDISKLLNSISELVNLGHSVIIIEHNMEVIKTADWIIDLGPDGGVNGGEVCFSGIPEDLVKLKDSNHTARFLAEKM
ncbi:MAG: excinuclease ABC subunit UvrA, partial [Cyclobacteriaceae bacterium]|nr:excinuclease ABC subunit UvrA [Cyclobacteriaceae bacterium]